MKLTRSLTALALTAVATTTLVAPIAAHADAPAVTNYVAMGDSYSAGHGIDSHPDMSKCSRNTAAYPALFARDTLKLPTDDSFMNGINKGTHTSVFVACQGATTQNIDRIAQTAQHERNTQVNALSKDTQVVTISIGGNDLDAAGVGKDCADAELGGGDHQSCLDKIDLLKKKATDQEVVQGNNFISTNLHRAYQSIKAAAPNAKIYVMGYPEIYGSPTNQSRSKINDSRAIGPKSREAFNDAMDLLDGTIQKVATEEGLTFVDVRPYFIGHGAGSDDTSYMNGVVFKDLNDDLHITNMDTHRSFHPNAEGHQLGDLPALNAAYFAK